jgi:cytochrome c553
MLRLSKLAMVCWGTAAMLAFSGASFADDAQVSANVTNGKNIFANGKPDGSVPACSSCHGEKAMGNDDMGTPRLANIGYVYVVKQLTNFAEDKRTPQGLGAVMNGFAKALTPQEKRDIAAYVNTLPLNPERSDLAALKAAGTPVGEAYKGKILVRYGGLHTDADGTKHYVSACQTCHGFDGRGSDPVYPKIGQQKFVYLTNQLKDWRAGAADPKHDPANGRVNDPLGQMRAIAKHLTDDDIANAATYLSQAEDSTPGDGMEIDNQTVMKNVKLNK